MVSSRLKISFFRQKTLIVAKELIGKQLIYNNFQGIITETEAYFGDDPASHASKGKTPRNTPMFFQAGTVYVYLIYGMYYCLNIVTERENYPAAVLIRGLYLPKDDIILNGPGKLCKHLGITLKQNKLTLAREKNFYITNIGYQPSFQSTSRIGISKAQEKLWRFVVDNNNYFIGKKNL